MTKNKIIKLRNRVFILVIVVISIIGGLRTYDDYQRNNQILAEKKSYINNEIIDIYNEEINHIKTVLEVNGSFISNSKEVKEFFKNENKEALYDFTYPLYEALNKNFDGRNIIHFHKNDHNSFLRVHKKWKNGDNLQKQRPIVSFSIDNKRQISGFEHCKEDFGQLTFRKVFPIFDEKEFLGVVELGISTKYISSLIQEKIKRLFDSTLTISYILNNHAVNFKHNKEDYSVFKEFIYPKNELIDKVLKKSDGVVLNQKLFFDSKYYEASRVNIDLEDFTKQNIGHYLYVLDITKDMNSNKEYFYSSLAKPVVAIFVIIILIGWIFLYFYKNFLKLEKRTRTILDAQKSLIVLTDGSDLLDCNISLLDFYGFKTLDEFKKKYRCICDTFEKGDNFLQKEQDGKLWINYLADNIDTPCKVAIKNKNGEINFFNIVLSKYIDKKNQTEEYFVVNLTNISDLEKINAQLIEQSKQASLGEMIGNIAHQWRQPLSYISTIASAVSINAKYENISNSKLCEDMDSIVEKTKYLSDTIDIFRNFMRENKELKEAILQERIDLSITIVKATLDSNHINLIKDIDYSKKIITKIVVGELSQVIINIINNSKDAFIENNVKNRVIKISLKQEESDALITIEDNAGGIPENILPNIFEPYFTTKHKSMGTGLGLYMSYKIVVESMKGKILVENIKDGAKFILKIPIVLD